MNMNIYIDNRYCDSRAWAKITNILEENFPLFTKKLEKKSEENLEETSAAKIDARAARGRAAGCTADRARLGGSAGRPALHTKEKWEPVAAKATPRAACVRLPGRDAAIRSLSAAATLRVASEVFLRRWSKHNFHFKNTNNIQGYNYISSIGRQNVIHARKEKEKRCNKENRKERKLLRNKNDKEKKKNKMNLSLAQNVPKSNKNQE